MLASPIVFHQAAMSFPQPSSHPSPPKRPRLSLQIKPSSTPQTLGKSVTALKSDIDPSSPTAFNTLSNAYAAAIENASPRTARPLESESKPSKPTSLRLQTSSSSLRNSKRVQSPSPFSVSYPIPPSPNGAQPSAADAHTPFTYTPPQSAHPHDDLDTKSYTFSANHTNARASPISPLISRRRATVGSHNLSAPYSHPRTLHSILRNSPLPPRTSTPHSPTSQHASQGQKPSPPREKRVAYLDPLTQTITTNKYIKSHIDLLAEEASPIPDEEIDVLELEEGGQTPGPFEEMRRRMAGLNGKKEKKRKWVWTIGDNEDSPRDAKVPMSGTPVTAALSNDDRDVRIDTPITAVLDSSAMKE